MLTLLVLLPGSVDAASASDGISVSIGVEVGSLTVDPAGPVGLGGDIHATLTGSPGCRAVISIPNVAANLKMTETSPGVYQGDYKVTIGHDLTDATVVAELTAKDGTLAPLIRASQTVSIDTTPPRIIFFTPGDSDAVVAPRPVFYAALSDGGGSGVAPGSVKIALDGNDVTGQCLITPRGVSYQPSSNLPPGLHAWTVSATDRAGNTAKQTRIMTIAAPDVMVKSVTGSATGTLQAGGVETVTVAGTAGSKAELLVPPLSISAAMDEVQPGLYRGMFKATPGSSIQAAPIVVRLAQGGRTEWAFLDKPLTISADPPGAPVITRPKYGDIFQGGIEAAGHADPGVTVICTVLYQTSSDGGVMPFGGTVLVAAVQSDRRGQWKTGSFDLRLQPLFDHNRDTRIDLTAVAVDAAGHRSQPQTERVDYYP